MYKLFFFVGFLAIIACNTRSSADSTKDTRLSTEDSVLYASWRTGQFYYKVRPFGIFLVNRYDTLQEEFIRDNGMLTEFGIHWINDSMYELSFLKLAENPQGISLPDGIDTLVKTCTMTNVSDTVYVEKAMSNLSSTYIYTKYRRPKTVQNDSLSIHN